MHRHPAKGETMTDTLHTKEEAPSLHSAGHAGDHRAKPVRRKRRPLRVALITLGSALGLVIVTMVSGYAYVSHSMSTVPRLRVTGLVAPVTPGTLDGQTFLITAAAFGPTGSHRGGRPIGLQQHRHASSHQRQRGWRRSRDDPGR